MSLFVLTGATGIGKTTCLQNWVLRRNDIGGFLSPYKDGLRQFYLISRQVYLQMEADGISGEECWQIGKYTFSKYAFEQAIQQFTDDMNNGLKICVLDEFGPLEQMNKGLLPGLDPIIHLASQSLIQDMIVVVRQNLVGYFTSLYPVFRTYNIQTIPDFFSRYPDPPVY